ncbi:hypothetical protein ABW21_db0202448 [Orbilia brochopaga]|nr:hypothetical protein ABW21_db0202448 [Drechslerella brochopaga]
MISRSFILAAIFAASALGVAIPLDEDARTDQVPSTLTNKNTLAKRDYNIYWDIWTSDNKSDPNPDPKVTDDAWAELKLKFPMKLFDTVSDTAYVSMNGFITLDKPSGPRLPGKNQRLPVDPTNCSSATGCMPKTIVAPMWQDLWIAPSFTTLYVSAVYSAPSGTSTAGATYTVLWKLCRKADPNASTEANAAECKKTDNVYAATLSYAADQPGIWTFDFFGKGGDKVPATVGVQSFPSCSQGTYPPSDSRSRIVFDTNKNTKC